MAFQPIRNKERARQLISFEGMELTEKAWPTDFDAVIEWRNMAWLVFEVKLGDAPVPRGQRLALERYVRDTYSAGKQAIVLVVEHDVQDPMQEIILAKCDVREVFVGGEFAWRPPNRPIKAVDAMREYIDYVGVR